MSIIERAETEVQRAMERARECVQGAGSQSATEVEAALWSALLALGRALMTWLLARRASAVQPALYEVGGKRYRLEPQALRQGTLGTRFGKVEFARPVGRAVRGSGRSDLPVDRELGLCSGFTLGTVTAVTRLCAMMAFSTARATFREFHEWSPSTRAVLRMVDGIGARAREFIDTLPAPEQDGEILVLQVDGRGAPMITATERERRARPRRARTGPARHQRRERRRQFPARERRKKGDKSKNAKVAFVGVIYTLRRTPEGVEGPLHKQLLATFQSHDALFAWLFEHAKRRGYGRKRTLFLGDGSEHIWRGQQKYFPQAEVCIDWYHVVERLWEAGSCLHAEGSAELRTWVGEQKKLLRGGRVAQLLHDLRLLHFALPKTGPGSAARRARLGKQIGYLAQHAHRMPYAELRRDGLDIGTGAVEGAVRNLVGLRLDGPGMRWGRERSELVLQLRCILLNGQWGAFCHFLAQSQLKLPAQPTHASPHDAVRQKAA